ncbi:hypothetical protein HK100_008261 [Physocladia obscura]|uniref:Uncharacterized protein n=1 Tax=Physocladia obscura TaxID=109957 RepID=A0AAD5XKY5_9FUNG|nr:hypothetical protein HK100_008261 [Physocladia obscura]
MNKETQAREDRIKELEAILSRSPDQNVQSSKSVPASPPLISKSASVVPVSSQSPKLLQKPSDKNLYSVTERDHFSHNQNVGKRFTSSGKNPDSARRPKANSFTLSSSTVNANTSWIPLVSRDFKGKPKNAIPATDKALLQILEEEQSKYSALDQTYHALLSEVKALQTAHIHEIRAADKRADTEISKANATALEKAEEAQTTLQDLKRLQTRFENLNKSREAEAIRFEFQHSRLAAQVKELTDKCQVLERLVEELKDAKQDLLDKIEKREAEMKKLILMYKDRENDISVERESRMKVELHILKLDQNMEQKETEIRILKEQLSDKSATAEDAVKFKEALSNSCKEVEQLSSREKMYLQEIESASSRERQLFQKLDELNASFQKVSADFDRSHAKDLAKSKEIEILKQNESKLKIELNSTYQTNRAQADDIVTLKKNIRQSQSDCTSLSNELADLHAFTSELKIQLKTKTEEVNSFRQLEIQLRKDVQTLKSELYTTQDDYASLQSQLLEVAKRLEMEVQSKSDIKNENAEKITSITDKIYEMQRILANTQSALENSQQREKMLRATLQQKDVTLDDQQHQLQEMERKIVELRAMIGQNEIVIETLKAKKKEDLIIIQEKFMAARQIMEQDVNTLKTQLSAKNVQCNAMSEEMNRMNFEISELSTEKFKIEMKLTDMSSNETTQSRNISTLQQQLRIKEQEINVMSIKQQALLEQIRVLDEELHSHRNLNLQKEGELQRIQNNVSEMNRKLREQVGVFLERSEMESNIGSSLPPSPFMQKKPNVPLRQFSFESGQNLQPDQKSIIGMDDLDSDLQNFLQQRNDYLPNPADSILAPNALK